AALAVYGLVLLDHTSNQDPFTPSSALLLTLSAVASIVFGVFRGRTIELFVRDGELWERASWANLGIGWGGLLVVRLGLIATAAAVGATLAASPTSIPLMLAITLAAQMVVVAGRAPARQTPQVTDPGPGRGTAAAPHPRGSTPPPRTSPSCRGPRRAGRRWTAAPTRRWRRRRRTPSRSGSVPRSSSPCRTAATRTRRAPPRRTPARSR